MGCRSRAIPSDGPFPPAMYEATARNLRTAERFLLEPALSGHFGASVISVCDISAKGARIKHGLPLEMGHKSALRLALEGRRHPVALEAIALSPPLALLPNNPCVSALRPYPSPH